MVVRTSEKRRWFAKMWSDSQESITEAEISWNNSDSETEDPTCPKRTKKGRTRTWVTILDKTPTKTTKIICEEFLDSPVISQIKLEDQSPILTQTNTIFSKEESPIISRNKIVQKIKWRTRCKKETEIVKENPSNISFSSDMSLTQVEISEVNSQLSESYRIDPYPSQHSTEISCDSLISASDSKSDLWYHPPPRRRRYKKGGLADQLQKAINVQSSSAAIWQHEIFLSKSKGEDLHQCNVSDCVDIEFSVVSKWREYGCTILKCKFKELPKFSHLEIDNYESFLVVAGSNNVLNICFEPNKSYSVYSPFVSKTVKFELRETLCIMSASRFICL